MQRITLVFVILLCLCSVVATAFVWQAVQSGQQVTAALLAEVKSLREEANGPKDETLKYLDWIPVTVKLDDENGEPVTDEKFVVSLNGTNVYGNSSDPMVNAITMKEHPDQNGLVDFGLVKPGSIWVEVTTPWQERCVLDSLVVKPGAPFELQISCPGSDAVLVDADIDVQWPEEFENDNLWTYLRISRDSRKIDGIDWLRDPNLSAFRLQWDVLLASDGELYDTRLYTVPGPAGAPQQKYGLLPEILSSVVLKRGDYSAKSFNRYDRVCYELSRGRSSNRSIAFPKHALEVVNEESVYADFRKPTQQVSIPDYGVQLIYLQVLQKKAQDSETVFQTVLPIYLGDEDIILQPAETPNGTKLIYQPSDLIVELVRKRLEQIDAEAKPREAGKTEAGEISAGIN